MNRDTPVAVVVPSYNRPERLRACLEALLRLEGPTCDIVVVDDGSKVPLAPVCAAFGPSVRCIRQENRGPAATRNAGVRATSARFVAFTDDDCRPRPDWIAKLVAAQEGRSERLVGGHVENGLPANPYAAASQSLCAYIYDYFGAAAGCAPFFTSNNMGCAREMFETVGGFDESFPLAAAEDRDFGLRWRAAGGALSFAPDAVVDHHHPLDLRGFWRQHANYGRGARHLHKQMAKRMTALPAREPIGFYAGLMAYPMKHPGRARLAQSALLALSQAAMIRGYAAEVRKERGTAGRTKQDR